MTSRAATLAATVAVLAGVGLAGPALATPSSPAPAVPIVPEAVVGGTELLAQPRHGEQAVTALGDDLEVAAARNDMGTGELRSLLISDPAAWVGPDGQVHFIDPIPSSLATGATAEEAPFPYGDTFSLHSSPDSDRVIYLDFDGAVVSGTYWNSAYSVSTSAQPSYDTDGDPGRFSDSERDAVQNIWQRVSEDFAPFDVDVTTQDPGAAALARTSSGDQSYGTRALITPSEDARTKICPRGCGGVATLGTYDLSGGDYAQPAWVFPQMLGPDNTKNIAEVVSHEVGHNLDLVHDGIVGGAAYYSGHGAWAPIMGSGYNRPITQWSAGEYSGADNTQDDLATIRDNGLSTRGDDHGDTGQSATAVEGGGTTVTGFIATSSDTDLFLLSRTCSGALTATANPAPISPDLDVRLQLQSSTGTVVASSNALSTMVDRDKADGLGAGLTATAAAGTYYLEVDGVGAANPASTGYSEYASLGAYSLHVTGCNGAPADAPESVAVVGDSTAGTATISWAPPASDGGTPVTGYEVSLDGASTRTLAATARSATFGAVAYGVEHTLSVRAVTAVGPGQAATLPVTLARPLPGSPTALQVTGGDTVATVAWSAPSNAVAAAVDGYRVRVWNAADTVVEVAHWAGGALSYQARQLTNGHTYTFDVTATGDGSDGAVSQRSAGVTPMSLPNPPGAPLIGQASPGATSDGQITATARWLPPVGGSVVTGYEVTGLRLSTSGAVLGRTVSPLQAATARLLKMRLPQKGQYVFTVRAVNTIGAGPASARSVKVAAR